MVRRLTFLISLLRLLNNELSLNSTGSSTYGGYLNEPQSQQNHTLEPLQQPTFHLPKFPNPNSYTSYIVGPVCVPAEPIRYPRSIPEIIRIVEEAITRNLTIKAMGSRHSTTDIICTDGIPLDMSGIQGIKYEPETSSVTVGAGVFLRDLCVYLDSIGRALKTIPGYGHITIGGAIGTGAHGSSIKHKSSISSQVIGVQVVDGRGHLHSITDEETLHAFRVHLGLLGIVVSITLETSPLYKVQAHNYVISDEILTNGQVLNMAREVDQLSLYWFPSRKSIVVANWTILPGDPNKIKGNAYTNDHVPPVSALSTWVGSVLGEYAQKHNSFWLLSQLQAYSFQTLLRTTPLFLPIYTEDGRNVVNPAIGIYHYMFAPICSTTGLVRCVWLNGPLYQSYLDNEVGIDLASLPALVQDMKRIFSKMPTLFILQGILLRFSGSSKSYMSNSYGADTVHVEWLIPKRRNPYETPSTGLAAYQAIMQTMVQKYKGRSHWGKTGFYYHSKNVLQAKVSQEAKQKFLKKMDQFDPNGIFLNDFGRRLRGLGSKINMDPATTHCALLDNCICSAANDCAPGQSCALLGGEFHVCK